MKEKIVRELVGTVEVMIGEGYEVWSNIVRKNNGVRLQAIYIKKSKDSVGAVIYIDQYVDEIMNKGMEIEYAASDIVRTYEENENHMSKLNADKLIDKEFILGNVEYQLVNKACNNKKIEAAPHKDILDLTALYSVTVFSDEVGDGRCVIDNKLLKRIGISAEELDLAAVRNTEKIGFVIKTMEEVLAEIIGIPAEMAPKTEKAPQIFVLTNRKKMNGAVVLMYGNIFKELSDRVGDDLFILPSSIHEVLAIPAQQNDPRELAAMVCDVNNREVLEEERLGYQVYRYTRATGELSIA